MRLTTVDLENQYKRFERVLSDKKQKAESISFESR